ncbi:hypothetical protein KR044_000962, partial [Drosophila immigrans]
YLLQCVMAHVTFTNLKCSTKNASKIAFQYCQIKAVNRTHKYISVYIKNFTRNINNITVNIKTFRFDNGYKPFIFDITFDACKYFKFQKNSIANMFIKAFRPYSNINHTCPYNHDLVVDKFWTGNIEGDFLKYLPKPIGEYCIKFTMHFYNSEMYSIQVYLHLT